MQGALTFTLQFTGKESDAHLMDFHGVARALEGFQRSIALTTHLVVNGEIIIQTPALKGARVLARPPEDGSWKMTAVVLAGIYSATMAPMDTPLGHAVHSVYDLLAALVPKPRVNLTRFHGVFAPNSKHRAQVTPGKPGKGSQGTTSNEFGHRTLTP
jgi:hypothetical protein